MKTDHEKQSAAAMANEVTFSRREECLDSFPKYVTRQRLTRFLSFYELFKMILPVEGSIVECGVFHGAGLMAWAKLSAILEPTNWKRKVIGFDTFSGFPQVEDTDVGSRPDLVRPGQISSDSYSELVRLIAAFDLDRFLNHIPKVELVRGDACETIPQFLSANRHLLVSLLYLDFDLHRPTLVAIQYLAQRMPKGAVFVFDNVDHPYWPGETEAVDEVLGVDLLAIRKFPWDPSLCYAVKE